MIRRSELSNFNHRGVKLVNTNYTLTSFDEIILVDCTAGAITITLPDAKGNANMFVAIKKIDSSANAVTIQGTNSQKIDGATTQSISAQWDMFELSAAVDTASIPMWQTLSIPTSVASGALPTSGGALTGALSISSNSANALVVGPNGSTNPVLNVDGSVSSQATGINIQGKAAGAGVAISVLSSGSNEALSINAKGSGVINIGNVSTGVVALGVGLTVAGNAVLTTANANALAVGANGSTNPVLNIDASTASIATGINIKGAAAAGGVAISVLSSGTNEDLKIDAKGSGLVKLATVSTGNVQIGRSLVLTGTGAGLTVNSSTLITTTTSLTDGAAAAAGTLTNAPAAGNPTKWIPVNDNGTTRYIPAW